MDRCWLTSSYNNNTAKQAKSKVKIKYEDKKNYEYLKPIHTTSL